MGANRVQTVQEILDHEGWGYEKKENDILFIVSFGTRKWKMDINCTDEGQVCCFAVYPWSITGNRLARVLEGINKLNLVQRRGCFMVNPTDFTVIYRCGVQILDNYTSYDGIKNILISSVASVNANWENIYRLIYGVVEGEQKWSITDGI